MILMMNELLSFDFTGAKFIDFLISFMEKGQNLALS